MPRLGITPLAALPALMLTACGSSEPVPENGDLDTQPMEIAAELFPGAPPAGGAASASQNDSWVYKPASRTAIYGPDESEGVLSIACRSPEQSELVVTRFVPAALGATGVLSFSGNNRTASVAVRSEPAAERSDSVWQGKVSRDFSAFREVFAGESGTVEIELSTGAGLIVPVSDAPLEAIDECASA